MPFSSIFNGLFSAAEEAGVPVRREYDRDQTSMNIGSTTITSNYQSQTTSATLMQMAQQAAQDQAAALYRNTIPDMVNAQQAQAMHQQQSMQGLQQLALQTAQGPISIIPDRHLSQGQAYYTSPEYSSGYGAAYVSYRDYAGLQNEAASISGIYNIQQGSASTDNFWGVSSPGSVQPSSSTLSVQTLQNAMNLIYQNAAAYGEAIFKVEPISCLNDSDFEDVQMSLP